MKARVRATCDQCSKRFVKQTANHRMCSAECFELWLVEYNRSYYRRNNPAPEPVMTDCDQCSKRFVKQCARHKRCSDKCFVEWRRNYARVYMREYRLGLRRRKALKRDHAIPLMAAH